MNLDYLKTFAMLARLGSFSAVARETGLSQPTVSFQIQHLEHELGLRLVTRGGRKITLTEGGKRLLEFASTITQETDKLYQDIDNLRDEVSGNLNLIASTTPGEFWLPKLVAQFVGEYPSVKASIVIGDSVTVLKSIANGSYDIGFSGLKPPPGQGMQFTKVAEDEIVLIVPPAHPLAQGERVPFTTLIGEPFISRADTSGTQKSLGEMLRKAGLDPGLLTSRLEVSTAQAVLAAVEAGAGIAFISSWAIKKSIALGLVRALRLQDVPLRRDFYCTHREERALSRLVREFVSFVNKPPDVERAK